MKTTIGHPHKNENSLNKNFFSAKISICILIITCILLSACSSRQSLNLEINNQRHSNYSTKYGNLPLDVRIYSTQKRHPFSADDYSSFWNATPQKHNAHLLSTLSLQPDTTYNSKLYYPKGDNFLIFLAHFYSPQQKKWFSIIKLPKHPLWQHKKLSANISATGVNLFLISKSWITQ